MDPVLSLLSTFYPKSNDETDKLTDRTGERGTEKEIVMDDKNGGQSGYSMGSNITADIRVRKLATFFNFFFHSYFIYISTFNFSFSF